MPSAGLRFLFTPVATLPPLAWCAELHRGDPRIAVRHGLLVETRDGGFFEGVWDAAFDEFGFAGAVSTMGSGACHEGSHIRFVAPSHTYESLCSLAEGDCLWISNSPAFALASAGDGPDIRYPFYHRDLLALQRRGITGDEPASFPTACRRRLLLHAATDLLIDRELSILVRPRPGRPAPRDFASYRAQLAESIAALLHNATDPARTKRLRCAATISAGYDSPAIGVLAAEAGLRQAITFESPEGSADSGRAIAEALGMQVHGIPPGRWRDLPEGLDAEFLVSSSGWAMFPLASLAEAWSNSVIFLGTMGDELWRRDRRDVLDSLARPNEFQPCYAGLREYRLRAGIVFVHGPTISATNASAIRCITRADDMLPWSVGGKYDRPIPRRIVETAGISREQFGQAIHMTIDTQTPEILRRLKRSSFAPFVKQTAKRLPLLQRRRLLFQWHAGPALAGISLKAAQLLHGAGRRLKLPALDRAGKAAVIRVTRRQWHEPMPILYTFHWAMAELIGRYRNAGAGGSVAAADSCR